MKKLISLFLALAMVFSLSVPAFATEATGDNTTQNVTASYTPSSTEDTSTLPNPLYFKAEGATTVNVYTYTSDAIVTNDNGEYQFTMTAVAGETGIFSVDTSSFSAETVQVGFVGTGFDSTDLIVLPTDGSNMYDYDNSQWTTYTPSSTEPDAPTLPNPLYFKAEGDTVMNVWTYTSTGSIAKNDNGKSSFMMTAVAGETGVFSVDTSSFSAETVKVAFVGSEITTSQMDLPTDGSNMYDYDNSQWTTYIPSGTAVTYDVNIAETTNGTVFTDKETAAAGETVTLTWTTEGTYELDNIVVEDADGNEVTITDQGLTAWTFTMPASAVTVTATFKEIATTSANISWGSLAYTYTDEAGEWSAGTAEGAGTVTVTNNGTTAITATPAYEATTTDYGTITGSFDVTSADLDEGESQTFKLSLTGTPTKAIPEGTKIGTVTVTITETTTSE